MGAEWAGVTRWLQIGSYTGSLGVGSTCPKFGKCISRNQEYGWYAENQSLLGYSIYDYGRALQGTTTTSRVVYNSASGCWETYLTYSGSLVLQDCTGEPATGSMWALLEVYINSGYQAHIPTYVFGTSNPNTNQAMRLHGANGWEPWDTSLTAQTTDSFDERTSTPTYVVSNYADYYYFLAYGP